MSARILISTTSLDELRAIAWQGTKAVSCYEQLAHILKTRLSSRHAALLAQPLGDDLERRVDWYFNMPGSDASSSGLYPVRLTDLPANTQAQARQTLISLGQDIYNLAQTLKSSADSNSATAGKLLEIALTFPSEEYIYTIADQPVLTGWGFTLAAADSGPEMLTRLRTTAVFLNTEGFSANHHAPDDPNKTQAHEQEIAAGPRPGSKQVHFHTLPWAIIAFLGTATFTALLLFWLLPKWGLIDLGGSCSRNAVPLANATQADKNSHLNDNLLHAQGQEDALRAELERLQRELLARLAQCAPVEPGPVAENDPVPEEPVVPENVPPPPEITLPEIEDYVEPDPVPKEAKPQQPKPDYLEIPEDTDNMNFLEGCWDAPTGLMNRQSGMPITMEFCFDKNGNGHTRITERDKNNNIINQCKGGAQAQINNHELIINDQGAICPDGRRYRPHTVRCRNSDNQAECTGTVHGDGQNKEEKWGPVPFQTKPK